MKSLFIGWGALGLVLTIGVIMLVVGVSQAKDHFRNQIDDCVLHKMQEQNDGRGVTEEVFNSYYPMCVKELK